MENVLVTGGAGFLGSNLVEQLLKIEKNVIVFDNGFRQSYTNLEKFKEKLTIVKGDVTKKEDWKKVSKDIDFAFHFAAINGTKFFYEIPETVINVNVQGEIDTILEEYNRYTEKLISLVPWPQRDNLRLAYNLI